jgi:hypothetical protein
VWKDTVESKCEQVNLLEIKAGRFYQRRMSWLTIDTNNLDKEHLKTLYKIKGFKEIPDITQIGNTIIIQYKNKPPILIDLDKNQIFIPKGYPLKSVKNQLEKVIRVLQTEDRVKNLHITTRKKKYTIPFIEKRRELHGKPC